MMPKEPPGADALDEGIIIVLAPSSTPVPHALCHLTVPNPKT